MDDYFYHVEVFTDGSEFEEPTTDEPHNSDSSIDNYYLL